MQAPKDAAIEFFSQLEAFSARVRRLWMGAPDLSPWGNPAFRRGQGGLLPDGQAGVAGAILHYTAGPSAKSAVQTFCDAKGGNGRSAHLVVDRGWDAEVMAKIGQAVVATCPLIAGLPAMPVQCRLPTSEGVHATWANRWAYGCEIASWGKLGQENPAGPQINAWGAQWQAILPAQLETTLTVLRHLAALCPSFSPEAVFSHEQVQTLVTPGCGGENKIDTGPLIDLPGFRAQLRGAVATGVMGGQLPGKIDPQGLRLLHALGYWDVGPVERPLAVFQFAMNLVPDGKLGPKTRAALEARVRDRMGPDAGALLA